MIPATQSIGKICEVPKLDYSYCFKLCVDISEYHIYTVFPLRYLSKTPLEPSAKPMFGPKNLIL